MMFTFAQVLAIFFTDCMPLYISVKVNHFHVYKSSSRSSRMVIRYSTAPASSVNAKSWTKTSYEFWAYSSFVDGTQAYSVSNSKESPIRDIILVGEGVSAEGFEHRINFWAFPSWHPELKVCKFCLFWM